MSCADNYIVACIESHYIYLKNKDILVMQNRNPGDKALEPCRVFTNRD